MKTILLTVLMVISSSALASEVVCTTQGGLTEVEVRITSVDLTSGKDTILIAANGMQKNVYELKPKPKKFTVPRFDQTILLPEDDASFGLSIDAESDIGRYVGKGNQPRIIEANLQLDVVGVLNSLSAKGNGKLTLKGDLLDTSPMLFPEYVLYNCKGEI